MNGFRRIGYISKKQNIIAMLVCMVGIALNMLFNALVTELKIPLYLDTVGTVAVAVMGGYLPGVVVGFMTNIIKSISDPSSLYYGPLNVLIAVCAAYIACRGWFRKYFGIFGAILVFTFIGGGIGSIIPWYMEGLAFDSESLSGILYQTGNFNLAVSHVLSSLIMDIPDKAITVLLVAAVIRLIPERFYSYCGFSMWMQNPSSVSEAKADVGKDKTNARVISLRTKVLLMLGTSLMIVAVVATVISMNVFHKTIIEEHKQLAQGTAKLAARVIDGDRVNSYLENAGNVEGYNETKVLLQEILLSSAEISFLYVYRIEEDGCHVVFDIDTEDVKAESTGSIIPFDEGFAEYIPKLLKGDEVDPIILTDKYGRLMTAYQPVYDSKGNTVCYAGVDVNIEQLDADERSFFMEITSVFLNFFILICIFAIWLTDYHIIYPICAITSNTDYLSFAGDSDKDLNENVKAIRSIDVHTGDEIEKLYHSLCQAALNQSEQMRSIRRLSDSTAKMQDGLIITMADMVENRDSDTGAHIQKTAAYVKIIVEGLKKKGYYAEKLTPKFMSDAVRSAPLHDVGKINIPDEVLNKPGKLTDEEYEIMKTHTTAGKRIMEHAISTVDGENYLKEARNMAAYHHERWDGRGYPEGLHGEVIPLSARIMAVADVFDALTSPRVYKPAFPLEKALSIIEEGKGTQFDPKCVEVFMDSLDEVKVVLKKYNHQEV